jgi:hypothetical protein
METQAQPLNLQTVESNFASIAKLMSEDPQRIINSKTALSVAL